MTQLANGEYRTKNGSILKVFGKSGGIISIDFDWLEEGACIDCHCRAYPENYGKDDWRLVWYCDQCGGGNAKLELVSEYPKQKI